MLANNEYVLEEIFSYLDPTSLKNCEKVCGLWKYIIKTSKKVRCAWKRYCKSLIPMHELKEIAGSLNPYDFKYNEHLVDWQLVFLCWQQWKFINNFDASYVNIEVNATDLCPNLSNPACVAVSGYCVLLGLQNGCIEVYNSEGNKVGEVAFHDESVECMELMAHCGTDKWNTTWDVNHKFVISVARYGPVLINSLNPLENDDHIVIVLRTGESSFFSWTITKTNLLYVNMNDVAFPFEIENSTESPLVVVPLDPYLINNRNNQRSSMISDFESLSPNLLNLGPIVVPGSFMSHLKISLTSKIWLKNSLFITCTDFKLLVGQNKENIWNNSNVIYFLPLLPNFVQICSICLYGQIFAVGSMTGNVFLYQIETEEDILELQLDKPIWAHSFSDQPITSIFISDTCSGPLLACTTKYEAFLVKFQNRFLYV